MTRVVYAVGDVHGEHEMMLKMLELISEDIRANRPNEECRVVFVGDYVDRGPASPAVVETLIALSSPGGFPGAEITCLAGNHEDMFLSAHARRAELPVSRSTWIMNGGDATLRQYKLAEEQEPGITNRHLDWIARLPLMVEEDKYVFVHAGVLPGVPFASQTGRNLLWIRHEFLRYEGSHFGKVVVHGHTPCKRPEAPGNRVNVDTGVCYGGPLTAAVLTEGGVEKFLTVERRSA